jgi:hypothetical protein
LGLKEAIVTIDNGSVSQIGMRRLLKRGAIAFAIVMSFRTFQFFPGMPYVQEVWYAVCFLTVLFAYPFWKVRTGFRFAPFELYLWLLMIAGLILAAWPAEHVFGQPFIYGILSRRETVLVAGWLILAKMLQRGIVELADIEAALLFLAWSTFVLYSVARLLFNPSDFTAYGEGLVTHPMIGVEPSFKFQPYFLIFGTFYYAIRGFRARRRRYYLAAAVLLLAALGGSGRGLALCAVVTLLVFLYRVRGFRRTAIAAILFAGVAAILGAGFYVIFPQLLSTRIAGFSDAFSVALTGSQTQDPSANARLFETVAALPYIKAHPFLGNGVVSHQWQGGTETAIGEYFFAADIGIFGIVFSIGIVGLLLYAIQYRIAWLAAKQLPHSLHHPFLDAIKAFILFSAFYSLETGQYVWDANTTIFFVVLLNSFVARRDIDNPYYNWISERWPTLRPALSA